MISKAIDDARVGLSKSLMTSPCERKGVYGEIVRDAAGRRLRFPLPERVTFGSAVDDAVTYITWHDRRATPWDLDEAIAIGLAGARRQLGWPLVPDPDVFTIQLTNAVRSFVTADDGLPRLRGLYAEGLLLQGNDGESLRADDVIGTPDYKTSRRVGDLKTWSRNDGARKFWTSPEMGVYAFLYAAENGELPETVFYQAYVRVSKPYWLWLEQPGSAELVEFGRQTAAHWRALLAADEPALLASANTSMCGDCPFRAPLPEYGHDGCPVGRLVPVAEEVAA